MSTAVMSRTKKKPRRRLRQPTFAAAVHEARVLGAHSLESLGKKLKVSRATIGRVENGSTPDLATFDVLCRWAGLEPGAALRMLLDR